MQVTDPCRKRPMRGREGLVVGKGIWWWGLPRKGSENCREEGAARGGRANPEGAQEMPGEEV